MKLYNAKKPADTLLKFCVLTMLTAWALIMLTGKSADAQDTSRDDFITACRMKGGSAITKFGSLDVYCATRPVNVYVQQP